MFDMDKLDMRAIPRQPKGVHYSTLHWAVLYRHQDTIICRKAMDLMRFNPNVSNLEISDADCLSYMFEHVADVATAVKAAGVSFSDQGDALMLEDELMREGEDSSTNRAGDVFQTLSDRVFVSADESEKMSRKNSAKEGSRNKEKTNGDGAVESKNEYGTLVSASDVGGAGLTKDSSLNYNGPIRRPKCMADSLFPEHSGKGPRIPFFNSPNTIKNANGEYVVNVNSPNLPKLAIPNSSASGTASIRGSTSGNSLLPADGYGNRNGNSQYLGQNGLNNNGNGNGSNQSVGFMTKLAVSMKSGLSAFKAKVSGKNNQAALADIPVAAARETISSGSQPMGTNGLQD